MVQWSYLAILAGAKRTNVEFQQWRPWMFRDLWSVNVLLLKIYWTNHLPLAPSNYTCIQSTWFLCLFVILKKRTGIEQEPLLKKSRHRQGWPFLINNVENALTSLVTFTWDLICSSSEDNVLGYLGGCSGGCFLSSSVFTSTNIQLVFKRPYVWDACLDPKIDHYMKESAFCSGYLFGRNLESCLIKVEGWVDEQLRIN